MITEEEIENSAPSAGIALGLTEEKVKTDAFSSQTVSTNAPLAKAFLERIKREYDSGLAPDILDNPDINGTILESRIKLLRQKLPTHTKQQPTYRNI